VLGYILGQRPEHLLISFDGALGAVDLFLRPDEVLHHHRQKQWLLDESAVLHEKFHRLSDGRSCLAQPCLVGQELSHLMRGCLHPKLAMRGHR